jgi:predicted anti-sigma-YlaC factor YlaD
MECSQFGEMISDYLDCGLARPVRQRFCEHLLACRSCHELFNDVREVMDGCQLLKYSQVRELALFGKVEQRIIAATAPGEMLSCRTLDALISDYFEGLIESSYEKVFKDHFAICQSCRQLVEGVQSSIAEQEAIEMPEYLCDRILAATVGARR